LADVWLRHCNPEDPMHEEVTGLLNFFGTTMTWINQQLQEWFLTVDSALGLGITIDGFLISYSVRCEMADKVNKLLWNMAPKVHWR